MHQDRYTRRGEKIAIRLKLRNYRPLSRSARFDLHMWTVQALQSGFATFRIPPHANRTDKEDHAWTLSSRTTRCRSNAILAMRSWSQVVPAGMIVLLRILWCVPLCTGRYFAVNVVAGAVCVDRYGQLLTTKAYRAFVELNAPSRICGGCFGDFA